MSDEQFRVAVDLDRASPVPLFHQLATALRYRIATGELIPGRQLPSLREGADLWSVNLHTVRRAYGQLEAAGLVRTSPRSGTRVLAPSDEGEDGEVERFLRETLHTARTRFGLGPDELVQALRLREGDAPVWVVECSASLAGWMAGEIAARWNVEARPWVLDAPDRLPAGQIVGSFFHYVDMRSSLPDRLADLSFVRIRPDPALLGEVAAVLARNPGSKIVLLETETSMAHSVAADLEHQLGVPVTVRIPENLSATLGSLEGSATILVSPRNWDRLDESARALPHVHPLRYSIEPGDLERLGSERGWDGTRNEGPA